MRYGSHFISLWNTYTSPAFTYNVGSFFQRYSKGFCRFAPSGYLLDLYIEQRSAWFSLPVRQAILAKQLNIAPETFSRQLTQFRRAGFIGGRNPEIVLLDINGLCASVGLPVPKLDLQKPRCRSASLGTGLFECCNYFKEILT